MAEPRVPPGLPAEARPGVRRIPEGEGGRAEAEAYGTKAGQVARLLMKHRLSLYGFIFACVRSHHDAEDILQETSVAAVESAGDLRDEAGFLPWAREIARRRVLAHYRMSSRCRPLDPEVVGRLAEAAERCEAVAPVSARREALLACLDRVPEDLRRVLALRYEGTLSVGQIAERSGRSTQAVYAVVKRTKAMLRECVARRLGAST